MGVFVRPHSPYWHIWLNGMPASRARINTKIPIGATPFLKRESRKLAEQVFAAMMGDRARDRFGLTRQTARTFAQQRVWYVEHVTPHKRGIGKEKSILKQLGAFFDEHDLSRIDRTLVSEWRMVRLKAVAPATINREEAVLKHLLSTAVPTYLSANPLAGLAGLRETEPDTRILTVEEEDRLLDALKGPEERAIVLVALDTLLRLSNVQRLTRQQDHGTYLYSDTKVGAVKIPISSRLRRALDAVPNTSASYFPRYASAKTTIGIIWFFRAACVKAKVQLGRKQGGVSFHCLRHTGASRMLAAGTDVKTVMRIGGWRNLRVMARYLHPTDAAAQAAVESIGSRPTTILPNRDENIRKTS